MSLPLEGIKVLECTQWQQGPAATALLGDLGADVIKIEEPLGGDAARGLTFVGGVPVRLGDWNLYFESFNRDKKSITLDLKTEKGKRVLFKLVERADAFVTNFRVGIPERLGIDHATLSKHNPALIYVHASSFGSRGPQADAPAFDISFQARSGLMASLAAPGGPPLDGPVGLADQMGAMTTCCAVLAGLLARERSGVAQKIETSGLGSMIWLQQLTIGVSAMRGSVAPRRDRTAAENPLWNYYCCQDGKWIILSMLQSDRYWPEFCRAIDRPELVDDPRFANASARAENHKALITILDVVFATRTREEWLSLLERSGKVIVGLVNTIEDVLVDPQVLANDYITEFDHPVQGVIKEVGIPIHFSETPAKLRLPAPELGENTEDILLEMGYTWEEIAELREENII